jgi:CRISPR type IV-associated protein Csf1
VTGERMLSPSFFATQALGLAMDTVTGIAPAKNDGPCGLCGVWLRKGETPAKEHQPAVDFGAADHLHPNRLAQICADCAVAVMSSSGLLTRYSRAIFTPQVAYRMSSAEDVGWMITQAQPPFVAIFNTKSSAHMLWQAPITHSRVQIGIALGGLVGTIRPSAVLEAHAALGRLTDVANEAMQSHYQWPVLNLTLYEDASDVCRLIPTHERILRQSQELQVRQDLQLFDALNLPERWALSALLLARPKRNLPIDDFAQPPTIEKVKQ